MQTGTLLGRSGQRISQAPQCSMVLSKRASQPLVSSSSQSPKPVTHTGAQRPPRHRGVLLGRATQAVPQAPQCVVLVKSSVSQPGVVSPSQSPSPGKQVQPPVAQA